VNTTTRIPIALACLAALILTSCAGNPLTTNDITKDGRIYRETEQTDHDTPRSTVKFKAAEF